MSSIRHCAPVALLLLSLSGVLHETVRADGVPPADPAGMAMADHASMAPGMNMGGNGGQGRNKTRERVVKLTIPAQALVREDGKAVVFDKELDDGRPVVVNFIYTTCFGICPISSQTFAQLQGKLGADARKVHLVSVSIDPEEDTPSVLQKYGQKYGAGKGWNHYTGTLEASIAVQKAFEVYKGDKMNHDPVTLMRSAPGKPWVRIDGFATADELLHTLKRLQSAG